MLLETPRGEKEADGGATVMFSFYVNLVRLLLELVVCSITSALGNNNNLIRKAILTKKKTMKMMVSARFRCKLLSR